jgi:site-specific recombinase
MRDLNQVLATLDAQAPLADFGFAPRMAFVSELNARLRKMLLPATPETSDSSELFSLAVPHAADPARVAAFDGPTLDRIARLIMTPAPVTGPPL